MRSKKKNVRMTHWCLMWASGGIMLILPEIRSEEGWVSQMLVELVWSIWFLSRVGDFWDLSIAMSASQLELRKRSGEFWESSKYRWYLKPSDLCIYIYTHIYIYKIFSATIHFNPASAWPKLGSDILHHSYLYPREAGKKKKKQNQKTLNPDYFREPYISLFNFSTLLHNSILLDCKQNNFLGHA